MKLKKIVSLALAGVLAVSMLAGCSVKAPETEPVTPTAGEAMASELTKAVENKNITFTYDTALEAKLQTAAVASPVTSEGKASTTAGVLANLMSVTSTDVAYLASTSTTGTKTNVAVYAYTTPMTTATLMDKFANNIGLSSLTDKASSGNVDYTYSYTAKVACVRVEGTGTNAGKYVTYVASVVTCTTAGTVKTAE